jgi:hypothetical protein
MTRRWFHAGSILILFAAVLQAQDRAALLQKLEGLPGFETSGSPQQYDLASIASFDPAIAPALRLYGSAGITVQQWETPKGMVKATLFQMLDAPAAYGVYTLKRSTLGGQATPVLIGAASFRHASQLYFWQSNYTVQIDGPEEPQNRLAQAISRNIFGRSQKPRISAHSKSRSRH